MTSGEAGECPVRGEGLSGLMLNEVLSIVFPLRQPATVRVYGCESIWGPGALTWAQQASRTGCGVKQRASAD